MTATRPYLARLARRLWRCGAVASVILAVACGSAPRRDLEFDRLHASLTALSADASLGRYALAERTLAEAAVRRLDASHINAEDHAHLAYLAERRVDVAYIAAQTAREAERLAALEREYSQMLLEASRRETAAVRAELDRQRRLELERAEEASRQPPPAAPSAPASAAPLTAASPSLDPDLLRRLTTLTPQSTPGGLQFTLEDLVFDPGTAILRPEAAAGIGRIYEQLARSTGAVRIEGFTDASGTADANLLLSQRRAEAVRAALVALGLSPGRVSVFGRGRNRRSHPTTMPPGVRSTGVSWSPSPSRSNRPFCNRNQLTQKAIRAWFA
ncbi:OmpA family protein [Tahibacter amnicola]|uniref:OmpA family protein n=1 Tax=Tahibacter amnicola TaxID=2976241 RepID=A0ABY6BKU3_9GAMM|nr:OmpA family protein [Tahibacter amnicola]UXI69206.1 OmpA family protein [Tahibacter amnicola]